MKITSPGEYEWKLRGIFDEAFSMKDGKRYSMVIRFDVFTLRYNEHSRKWSHNISDEFTGMTQLEFKQNDFQ